MEGVCGLKHSFAWPVMVAFSCVLFSYLATLFFLPSFELAAPRLPLAGLSPKSHALTEASYLSFYFDDLESDLELLLDLMFV